MHRLDLALWLMGQPQPTWVMGSSCDAIARAVDAKSGKAFAVDDLDAGFIRFENGATLVLEASWAARIRKAELAGRACQDQALAVLDAQLVEQAVQLFQ